MRIPLRIGLWSTPLLWALTLLLSIRGHQEAALLEQADALLVRGEGAAARQLLAELHDSPWIGEQARAGLALAAALEGTQRTIGAWGDELRIRRVDPSAFAVPLIIRTAFDRGEFRTVLRLTELAGDFGLPTVPLLTAAAWIEIDRINEARDLEATDLERAGKLGRRVAHHLATPAEQGGVLLRDRFGQPIGTVAAGEMTLSDRVRPELVPRAVADAADAHGGAGSLRLTLDLELSQATLDAFGRYRGSIVLVDPFSGEILAAVSDRRSWRKGGTPAFEQLREPASIAKLITSTAALRAGFDPDAELGKMRCRGHERYAGQLLYCPRIVGRLQGLDRAMAVSCNVAFANLGVRVGRQGMLREFRRYGFDLADQPFAHGRILEPYGDDRQLADLAIGLEATAITPLHAALLAAVMAADGVMPVPTLVAAEDGRLGLHPRPLPAREGRQVIDRRWVPDLVSAMETVVRRGTAQRVWPPPSFPVAMKTGTASDPRHGFHVNYIGIGPMPDARLAFCVRVTDQRTSAKVRYAAQQVTYRLLRNLGRIAESRGWSPDAPGSRRRGGAPASIRTAAWDGGRSDGSPHSARRDLIAAR